MFLFPSLSPRSFPDTAQQALVGLIGNVSVNTPLHRNCEPPGRFVLQVATFTGLACEESLWGCLGVCTLRSHCNTTPAPAVATPLFCQCSRRRDPQEVRSCREQRHSEAASPDGGETTILSAGVVVATTSWCAKSTTTPPLHDYESTCHS